METSILVEKQQQRIARIEKQLSLEKLKKRRADTRKKIEFGGLVIKSLMHNYNKSVILGALIHAFDMMENDKNYLTLFESIGDIAFLKKD